MTRPHQLTTAVRTARILLMTVEYRIDATEAALLAGADAGEGFPERGGVGHGDAELDVPEELRGGPTTTTEALALRRTTATRDLTQLRRAVAEMVHAVNRVEAIVRSHSGEPLTREFVDRLRCANPTKVCKSIADPSRDDHLCVEHGAEADAKRRSDSDARRQRRHAARGAWYGDGEPMAELRGAAQGGAA